MKPRKKLPLVCLIIYAMTAVSAVLYVLFTQLPQFADWFNRYISSIGRVFLAFLTNFLPFSLTELLLLLIPLWIVLLVVIAYRHYTDRARDTLVYVGILLSGICTVAILFVWNFAAGYFGTTLDQKLSLDRQKVSAAELYETAEHLNDELCALTDEIVFAPDGASVMPYSHAEMNQKLLDAYEKFCEHEDFLHTFRSRIKPVLLSEPMSYTHITGVYTFFTGEANLNVNFPDYTLPYTAAHELAHQRGIAREDEANFVAFLVCLESDDAYLRYSALLSVYEYVASALYSADAELYRQSYTRLPSQMRAERTAYVRFFDKYRENVAATVSEATNNLYLQSQGAKEGTKSYGMVVDLAVAYYRTAP